MADDKSRCRVCLIARVEKLTDPMMQYVAGYCEGNMLGPLVLETACKEHQLMMAEYTMGCVTVVREVVAETKGQKPQDEGQN